MNIEKTYGLIGYPLSHSFSPNYFAQKFKNEDIVDAEYLSFPIKSLDELKQIKTNYPALSGLNVTIPYKESILPFLDKIDPTAASIGAVNTIKIQGDEWVGYNTDIDGFYLSLQSEIDHLQFRSALILGSGGASKAAQFVLKREGIPFRVISRKGSYTYGTINRKLLASVDLIINCTPLGMYPDIAFYPPLPYSYLSEKHFLYDMIYNPEKTIFLSRGEANGCRIRNGQKMLEYQAEASWKIWQSLDIE